MSSTTQASCFCMGKAPNCTCNGRCRCACTCTKDKADNTYEATMGDWFDVVDPNEGQEIHRTRKGKGVVGQAIAKDKKRKLPPNCS